VTLAVNVDPAANLNPEAPPTIFGQLGIPEYARNDPELIDCVPAKPGPEIVPDVVTVPEIALAFMKQYPIVVMPDESTGLMTTWMLALGVAIWTVKLPIVIQPLEFPAASDACACI
jgi:hypothetical protein